MTKNLTHQKFAKQELIILSQ